MNPFEKHYKVLLEYCQNLAYTTSWLASKGYDKYDILQDAYIDYDKNKHIFLEENKDNHLQLLKNIVYWTYIRIIRKTIKLRNGSTHYTDDTPNDKIKQSFNNSLAEKNLFDKELKIVIKQKLNKQEKQILNLRLAGYDHQEINKLLPLTIKSERITNTITDKILNTLNLPSKRNDIIQKIRTLVRKKESIETIKKETKLSEYHILRITKSIIGDSHKNYKHYLKNNK